MGYYPIAIDLTDQLCLVVGGGIVALRKVVALGEAGARVTVISPKVDASIEAQSGVSVFKRTYEPGDAKGYTLVFAATDDRTVNTAIFEESRALGIPVNVVDDPELCTFIVPALLRRGDLLIAVTTSGRCPVMSKKIRRELEHRFGPEYADYVDLLGEMRDLIKGRYANQSDREAALGKLVDEWTIPDLIRQGNIDRAREIALGCI